MERAEILDRAKQIVAERNNSYGKPEDNFARIARLWNAHLYNGLGMNLMTWLEPHDVAIMLACVKLARICEDPRKADNWIDLAGYAACGGEVAGAAENPFKSITSISTANAPGQSQRCEVGDVVKRVCNPAEPEFKPGDLVECIDDDFRGRYPLKKGRVYEVEFFSRDHFVLKDMCGAWWLKRFKKAEFQKGETVNLPCCRIGQSPGIVKGYSECGAVEVQWITLGTGIAYYQPAELRHGA